MRGEEPRTRDASPHQCRRATSRGTLASVTPQDRKAGNLPHSNLAARAGRWSAQHRKTAVFGWLAFVVDRVRHRRHGRHQDPRSRGAGQRLLARRPTRPAPTRSPKEASESSSSRPRATPRPPTRRSAPRSTTSPHGSTRAEERHRRRVPARQGQRGPDLRGRALRARDLQGPRRPGGVREERRHLAGRRRRRAEGAPRAARRAVRRRLAPPRRSTRRSRRTSSGPRRSRSRSRC